MGRRVVALWSAMFIIALFAGQAGFNLYAQTSPRTTYPVSGWVADDEKQPMEYVSVFAARTALPDKIIDATITGKDGRFELKLPKGNYLLRFRMLGYKTESRSVKIDSLAVNLSAIDLKEDPSQLPEVTIRPLIEQNAREITYNITSDPSREKSNMLDMFAKLPLLSVINGEVVAENDKAKKIIVLRNGRADALFSDGTSFNEILRKLPAMGFTNIKILLEKPEKYAEYDYVISVTADKSQRLFGTVGTSNASYELTGNLSLGQKITGSADKLRISADAGYMRSDPPTRKNSNTISSPNYSYNNNERLESETNRYIGNFMFSLDLSKKQFLSGNLAVSRTDADIRKYATNELVVGTNPATRTNSTTYTDNTMKAIEGKVAYHYDLTPNKNTFSASYTVKTAPTDNIQRQESEGSASGALKRTHEGSYSHYLSLDYRDKLTRTLTLSGRTSLLISNSDNETRQYNTSSGTSVEASDAYNLFERPVKRIDGSLSLSWLATKNISLLATLRPDYMFDSSKIKQVSGSDDPLYYSEHDWTFGSNVGISILFPKKQKPVTTPMPTNAMSWNTAQPNKLNINYIIKQNRPPYLMLSNYVDNSNPDYLLTGNPSLKNETVHSVQLDFTNNIVSPSLEYSFSNDKITSYWYLNEADKLVRSYANGGSYRRIQLTLNKSLFLNKDPQKMQLIALYALGGYSKEEIDGNDKESYRLMGMVMYQGKLLKVCNYSVNFNYFDYWNSGYSGSKWATPFQMSVSLNRSFALKKSMRLQTSVRCNNIFKWRNKVDSFVQTDAFSQKGYSLSKTVPIVLSLALNFGTFKVKPVKQAMSTGVYEGFSAPVKSNPEGSE